MSNDYKKENLLNNWENIIKMFQVDLNNWFEMEFILLKNLRIQPSELDRMDFYRVELIIENFKKYAEKEKEAQKDKQREYSSKFSDLKSGIKMPSMPKTSGFNFPKF